MARVLVMSERTVSISDRASYVSSLVARKQSAGAVGANLWVFERDDNSEKFLEFVEAGSTVALSSAIESTSGSQFQSLSHTPVWREVSGA
ncbi:MAG: hypothetical protein ABJC26_12405 [Gemmatimonadaceae bacterium]